MRAERHARRVSAVLVAVLALGCQPAKVSFRIVDAIDQDPYVGANQVRITLRDRDEAPLRTWTFDPLAANGNIDPLPIGSRMVLVVEAMFGDRVLARGRSFPFDLSRKGAIPHPDVYLGRLGRFATPLAGTVTTGSPLGITATSYGALYVDDKGGLRRIDVHDRASATVGAGEPSMRLLDSFPTRADATFAALPNGRLFGVGGTEGDAILLDENGRIIATLPATTPEIAAHRFGASVGHSAGSVVLVGGSSTSLGPPTNAVTRIDIATSSDGRTTLVPVPITSLPTERSDATAVTIDVLGRADCPCARLAIVGGRDALGPRTTVSLIDPLDLDPIVELDHPSVRPDAATFAISDGVLVLAGGRDSLGAPVDSVDVLITRTDAIVALSPSAPPLFSPRAGAASVVLTSGLALVLGGVTTLDAPSSAAELIEFPGNTLATGSLVTPAPTPRAVVLGDHSVLAVDVDSVSVYVSPRDL